MTTSATPAPKVNNLSIAHSVPGRIRMKIPAGKGNAELLDQIKETFSVIPGIESIDVNALTGSVVVSYDADRHDEFHGDFHHHASRTAHEYHRPPVDEIEALAQKIGQEAEFLAEHSHTARVFVDFCKQMDRSIKKASGNMVDLKILLAVAIIGVTVFEIGAGAATPVWVTLVVFGVNHFIEMHQHQETVSLEPAFAGV